MPKAAGPDGTMLDPREHTRERDQLDELLDVLRQGQGNDPQIGYHAGLAVERWRMPPRIQVTGRAHTGRTTVLHALALMSAVETGPVDEPGLPDPVLDGDIIVYVLAAAPGPADQRIIGSLPPDRTIVVLNKADAVGARWADAVIAAEQYGRELGRQVLPVVASLAVRTRAGAVTEADLATLRRHAGNTDPAFTLSPDLFTAPSAGPDVAERTQLLQRWICTG